MPSKLKLEEAVRGIRIQQGGSKVAPNEVAGKLLTQVLKPRNESDLLESRDRRQPVRVGECANS